MPVNHYEKMDVPLVFQYFYEASTAEVWRALVDENQMRTWYFPQLLEFKPVVGFEFVFSNDGSPYQKEWRVTKVEDEQILAHSWIYKGYPGRSVVTFELTQEGPNTALRLTHSGLESFPKDPHFARSRFENGWKQILGSNLKDHLRKNSSK
jgi:uncharacterized protein YndB with AHSA1/START domain